jgi:hypothetical protein
LEIFNMATKQKAAPAKALPKKTQVVEEVDDDIEEVVEIVKPPKRPAAPAALPPTGKANQKAKAKVVEEPEEDEPEVPKATRQRGPAGVEPTAKIEVMVDENPKRQGSKSHARFELYREAETVQDFINMGGLTADLIYDVQHEFITIEGYEAPPLKPKTKKAKVEEPAPVAKKGAKKKVAKVADPEEEDEDDEEEA